MPGSSIHLKYMIMIPLSDISKSYESAARSVFKRVHIPGEKDYHHWCTYNSHIENQILLCVKCCFFLFPTRRITVMFLCYQLSLFWRSGTNLTQDSGLTRNDLQTLVFVRVASHAHSWNIYLISFLSPILKLLFTCTRSCLKKELTLDVSFIVKRCSFFAQ